MKDLAKKFIDFSYSSPNGFFAVENGKNDLKDNGFIELSLKDRWALESGGKHFVTVNESSLFAFEIGSKDIEKHGYRIVGSHTDSPGIKIKPNPEIIDKNYLKLNVEIYGGPILNTWLDRPLSIAGRVYTKSDSLFNPKLHLVDLKKPLLIIPNLAIHQNREVNKGVELNRQVDMLPIVTLVKENFEKEGFLISLISKNLDIKVEDILDFELYLYEVDKGQLIGLEEEFLSASRIDNLASMFASTEGLKDSDNFLGVKVVAAFDNEEIGSRTKQGADSVTLATLLEKISYSLGKDKEDHFRALQNSFMLSADGAHAIHPNQGGKTDPTNIPKVNEGISIKYSSNFSYTTDAFSGSVIKALAGENSIKVQYFVNRSDLGGGSTIGPLSSKHLPINSVDLGLPMIAMHSVRELCGVEDLHSLKKLIEVFFSTKN